MARLSEMEGGRGEGGGEEEARGEGR